MCIISPPDLLQRASGVIRLDTARRASRSRIISLRQQGCLKLLFPRVAEDEALQAVVVNCSGGIAAGDRLDSAIACAAGSHLVLTAQAAERCYRARPGEAPAQVTARVRLEAGSSLEWLPQETILFEGARLQRRLEVELAAGARFLGLESRVFGRALHGERMRSLDVSDRLLVRRDGRPVLVDAFELHGDAEALLARAAVGAGAVASATIVLVAADAEALLGPVRELLADGLAGDGTSGGRMGEAGASAWDGMLVVRMVSPDARWQRGLIAALLSVLRGGRKLPAVWRC